MTPELRLAQILSSDDERQKIANAVSTLSVEELETLIKEGMPKEEIDEDALRRATYNIQGQSSVGRVLRHKAWPAASGAVAGGILGAAQGHDVRGGKGALIGGLGGALLGGVANHFGSKAGDYVGTKIQKKIMEKGMAHKDFKAEYEKAKKEKKSSAAEKIAMADEWGRELAQSEKTAGIFNDADKASKFVGRVGRIWEKHGKGVREVAGKAGKAVGGAFSSAGKAIGGVKDPVARGAALGAAMGGVGGAVQGFVDPKEDPYTGEKYRLRTAFKKGVSGAAGGAATGALFGGVQKHGSVVKLEEAMQKRAGIFGAASGAAKNFVAAAKPVAAKAMAAAAPHVQAGAKVLRGATGGQVMGAGAAAGGALGAAKGLVAPGKDAQGNTKSRIGGAIKGGVGGAVAGGALGAGAKLLSNRMGPVAAAPMKMLQRG